MVLFLLLGAGILAGRLHHQRAPAGVSRAPTSHIRITGSISSDTSAPGCASGPNVVHAGASVIVLDPNGAVLATTTLGTGRAGAGGVCTWRYAVSVPTYSTYQLQVAGLPPVVVSRDQLLRDGGRFSQRDRPPSTPPPGLDTGM
jgi:hypothetical protein